MNNIIDIYNILLKIYGFQYWWPIVIDGKSRYLEEFSKRERTSEEIFEICIGAILTQNTAWKNVEKALINLKTKTNLDIKKIQNLDMTTLAELIKPSGYFNQKSKKIKAFLNFINDELKGDIIKIKNYTTEKARNILLSVWGIGRETADSILLYAYDKPIFVTDAYTRRIFSRVSLIKGELEYDLIQKMFHENLPQDSNIYKEYHALIVAFAKDTCKKEPSCDKCCIRNLCNI